MNSPPVGLAGEPGGPPRGDEGKAVPSELILMMTDPLVDTVDDSLINDDFGLVFFIDVDLGPPAILEGRDKDWRESSEFSESSSLDNGSRRCCMSNDTALCFVS